MTRRFVLKVLAWIGAWAVLCPWPPRPVEAAWPEVAEGPSEFAAAWIVRLPDGQQGPQFGFGVEFEVDTAPDGVAQRLRKLARRSQQRNADFPRHAEVRVVVICRGGRGRPSREIAQETTGTITDRFPQYVHDTALRLIPRIQNPTLIFGVVEKNTLILGMPGGT